MPTDTASPQPRLDDAIAEFQTELNRLDRAAAVELDVGSAEDLQMLRLLDTLGPRRVGELATARAAGNATVSARIDRLERRGLVERERDPADRRAVVVRLTPEGRTRARRSRHDRRRRLSGVDSEPTTSAVLEIVAALREQ